MLPADLQPADSKKRKPKRLKPWMAVGAALAVAKLFIGVDITAVCDSVSGCHTHAEVRITSSLQR